MTLMKKDGMCWLYKCPYIFDLHSKYQDDLDVVSCGKTAPTLYFVKGYSGFAV